MEYTNPLIKVTWADTPEAFTPERIKRVKEYFKAIDKKFYWVTSIFSEQVQWQPAKSA